MRVKAYLVSSAIAAGTLGLSSVAALAQNAGETLAGPDATPSILRSDESEKPDVLDVDLQESFDAWKANLKERTGLDFGLDYNALGFAASESLGDKTSASGAFRLFGTWDLVGRDSPNTGSLVFKIENRHGYTDVPPTDFGFEIGYVGLVNSVFSDQGWRATHLYWQQDFAQGRGVAYVGWLDVTDYLDVYAMASPWTGFSNLAFQTGSGSIGGLPDGALGAMLGGFLNENFYASASIADANADATDPLNGFETFFDDFETFKTFEIGWTTGARRLFVDNAHVTLWQIDAREAAGTPSGHGAAFSLTTAIGESWLPFLRGGWADGGGSLYEASISAGFGHTRQLGRDLLGVGLNWSRPNSDTFGDGLDDQVTLEAFQRWQITEGFEVTPSLQLINSPALNPDKDNIAMLGLRLRAAF